MRSWQAEGRSVSVDAIEETMPTRGGVPRLLLTFIIAFACLGFVGSQVLKQRRVVAAALVEKDYRLHSIENDLKKQASFARERQEERDFAQKQLVELERISQSALNSLRARERELADVRRQHQRTVDEVEQLKRVVDQKEGEIVYVRGKLQEYSFERANESAEQLRGGSEKRQAEEHRPADEAGLGDRAIIQEEERLRDATEREMDERSRPKEGAHNGLELGRKPEDSFKPDLLPDDYVEELEEREMDASQVVDVHELTKLEADLQSGEHEEVEK